MTRHIRSLSQRARLAEFVFSESGAMSAQKAAQMGAVLAATTLAGILMSAGTAESHTCHPCMTGDDCMGHPPNCHRITCGGGACGQYCTNATFD